VHGARDGSPRKGLHTYASQSLLVGRLVANVFHQCSGIVCDIAFIIGLHVGSLPHGQQDPLHDAIGILEGLEVTYGFRGAVMPDPIQGP